MNTFLRALNWRYATKKFDPSQKLTEEQRQTLFDALRLSPSSSGLQPWHFLHVTENKLRREIQKVSFGQPQVVDASDLLILCRRHQFSEVDVDRWMQTLADGRGLDVGQLTGFRNSTVDNLNRMSPDQLACWMSHQVYLALGILLSACAVNGIDACPMEGFQSTALDELLQLPAKGLNSVVLCPVGFRSSEDAYAQALKVRFPLEDLVTTLG